MIVTWYKSRDAILFAFCVVPVLNPDSGNGNVSRDYSPVLGSLLNVWADVTCISCTVDIYFRFKYVKQSYFVLQIAVVFLLTQAILD